jgi:hypothetical protein
MKLTLEPTDKIQSIDGSPSRLWTGVTEKGVPVHAYIRCVSPQTHDAEANAEFSRALQELPKPRREGITFDMRFII